MNPLLDRFLAGLYDSLGGAESLCAAKGAALPYLLAAHLQKRAGAVGVLVSTESEGERLRKALDALLGEGAGPAWLPAPDVDPYEGMSTHQGILLERAIALTRCATARRPLLLCSVSSFLYRVPKPGWWRRNLTTVEAGCSLDRQALRLSLWRMGYRQVDQVGEAGEAAFRGGIVDLFPPRETLPVRLEFFGDEVDSLRHFDPVSQRSLGEVGRSVLLHPLSEAIKDDDLIASLREELAGAGSFGEVRLEGLNAGGTYPSFDTEVRQNASLFGSLPAFLGADHWVVLDPEALKREAGQRARDVSDSFVRTHRPDFLSPHRLFEDRATLHALLEDPRSLSASSVEETIASERPPLHPGDPVRFLEDMRERIEGGYRCLALLQGRGSMDRLGEMALSVGLTVSPEAPAEGDIPPGLYAVTAPVEEGVLFPGQRWLAVTGKEIFGRSRVAPRARVLRREAFSTGLRDLKVGDPVVHVEHGVARYTGIETIVRGGVREDYLRLAYAGGSRLLVPVTRMDLVQKYVGPQGYSPPLDQLGGKAWARNKEKARKAIKKVAVDLLRLYTARRTVEGVAYPPDSQWQAEFESQFPYELTPDQEAAVGEIKGDLESGRPMDRLVCGDVGFGKTEVAMRAAFKVVQEGRQVAVLCPTTVLALQHLERFRDRFAPFPVSIGMLSRFVSPGEQKEVIRRASEGKLDILIGTHRLLSKDVQFPTLGLLVVDEEQRFGVGHKEKVKALKSKVDVLTLTATPIPRTLQMGLSGLVSMSLIQTAPKDRLSIQTSVRPYDEEVIVSAIRRETARGGQVYYVHNKIDTIAAAADRIRKLIPGLKVTVAHGRMGERELEEVMLAFFHGEYDLLVCTTIIENGVDLARVNTLIVEDAHTFGLTQLYQLRGRIGRSDLPAYAFLLTPPGQSLSGDAAKRLETLREFSELGAGFRVAAADLELRGAGNLLGGEQSGHMAAVGFELYLRMLEDAVAEARGEGPARLARCEMNLALDLAVPMEYMEEMNHRLALYRDLSLATDGETVSRVLAQVTDRFGPPPEEVIRMARATTLRIKADSLGVHAISSRGGVLSILFDPEAPLDAAGLVAALSGREAVELNPSGALTAGLAPGEDSLSVAEALLKAAAPGEES